MTGTGCEHDRQLGALLRLHRVARGLSPSEVATLTGLTVGHLMDVETGASRLSVKEFEEVSYALGVSAATVLTQLQRRMEFVEASPGNDDEEGMEFLASNRGRQLIRAIAACRNPRVLDAVSELLFANALRGFPESRGKRTRDTAGVDHR